LLFRHGPNSVTVGSSHPIPNFDARCARSQREKAKRRVRKAFSGAACGPRHFSRTLSRPRLARHGPRNSNPRNPLPAPPPPRERAGPEKQQAEQGKPDHRPETATTRHLVHLSSSPPDLPFPTPTGYPPPVPPTIKPTRAGTRWWWWRWEAGVAAAAGGGRGRSWCWAAPCYATGAPRGPPSPTSSGPAPRAPSRPRSAPRTLSNPSSRVCVCSSRPTRTRIRAWPLGPPPAQE
jgi:hypothetical protein